MVLHIYDLYITYELLQVLVIKRIYTHCKLYVKTLFHLSFIPADVVYEVTFNKVILCRI